MTIGPATPLSPAEISQILETVRRKRDYVLGMIENCEACYADTGRPPEVHIGKGGKGINPFYLIMYTDESGERHLYNPYSYVKNKEKYKKIHGKSWTASYMTFDQLKAFSAEKGFS